VGHSGAVPHVESPLYECEGVQVLSGYATTLEPDLERVRWRDQYALSWWPHRLPVLDHAHGGVPVGRIDDLRWTPRGLSIAATTDHPLARCCAAWSIAATIRSFEIVDADTPDYVGVITSAWLDSVSLTNRPAHPQALVHERVPQSPLIEQWALLQRAVEIVRQKVIILQEGAR
jgi:hypothetical protein